MTIQEIFKSEERNKDNLFDIHFYMEGAFWRAYEWSAYLSRIFPSELTEEERLKVLKKATKDYKDGYVQVGLRLPSFKKYFPSLMENEELMEVNDKHIILHAKSFFKEENFLDYKKVLSKWKSGIHFTVNEKKKLKEIKLGNKEEEVTNNQSADSLIKEIISYPIENKNLVESLQFLSHIRDTLIKISNKER